MPGHQQTGPDHSNQFLPLEARSIPLRGLEQMMHSLSHSNALVGPRMKNKRTGGLIKFKLYFIMNGLSSRGG